MGDGKHVIRKKLGLIFFNDEQWIGGTYYTLNLVHALNTLPINEKPEIVVFSNSHDFQKLKAETNYPYLSYEEFSKSEYSNYERLINKISIKIFKKSSSRAENFWKFFTKNSIFLRKISKGFLSNFVPKILCDKYQSNQTVQQ